MPEIQTENRALTFPWFTDDAQAMDFVGYGGTRSNSFELSIEEALGGLGGPTKSGVVVGPESALRVSTAAACRRVISEDIAKLPRRVVREVRDPATGRIRSDAMVDHPVHRLLNDAPNDWMTPFEFVQFMVGVATFHPGAYALVQRDAKGSVTELLPMLPGTCAPEVDTWWQVKFRATGYGETLLLDPRKVFRLNGPMADPWRGVDTVSMAREAIGLAAAIEASQARFHANDLRPSGLLTTQESLKDEQRDAIRSAWKKAYGEGGDGGVAVLDNKFSFEAITAEGAKSEVIENRKFQISDMCRFFRVFPTVIGHNDGSQTFASVEAMFTAHAVHTLQPWVERFEEAATLGLLTEAERRAGLRVDLDMDNLLRGTPSERANYYERATKVFMTPNEARVREGLDPITGDPDMDRVQLQRNNTGTLALSLGAPEPPPASRPVAPDKARP